MMNKKVCFLICILLFSILVSCTANTEENAKNIVIDFLEDLDRNTNYGDYLNLVDTKHYISAGKLQIDTQEGWIDDYYRELIRLLVEGEILKTYLLDIERNDTMYKPSLSFNILNYDNIISFANVSKNNRLKYGLNDTLRIMESRINKAYGLQGELLTGFKGDGVFHQVSVTIDAINDFSGSIPLDYIFWIKDGKIVLIGQMDLAVASFLKATMEQ